MCQTTAVCEISIPIRNNIVPYLPESHTMEIFPLFFGSNFVHLTYVYYVLTNDWTMKIVQLTRECSFTSVSVINMGMCESPMCY